jgi:hypothetical protein
MVAPGKAAEQSQPGVNGPHKTPSGCHEIKVDNGISKYIKVDKGGGSGQMRVHWFEGRVPNLATNRTQKSRWVALGRRLFRVVPDNAQVFAALAVILLKPAIGPSVLKP